MDDGLYASIFFLIFAVALALYSQALIKTGDKKLMPWRIQRTVRGPEDVRIAGRATRAVAFVIAGIACVFIVVCSLT